MSDPKFARADTLAPGDLVRARHLGSWWEVVDIVPLPTGLLGVKMIRTDGGARRNVRYRRDEIVTVDR